MKGKYIVLLIVCAIVTLSFTLISTSRLNNKAKSTEVNSVASPAGGIASEDPIK